MMEFLLEIFFEIVLEILVYVTTSIIKNKWVQWFLKVVCIMILIGLMLSLITFASYLVSIHEYRSGLFLFLLLIILLIGVIWKIKKKRQDKEECEWML